MAHDGQTRISALVGLLLCVGIWFAVPWNNFALNNSFICDGYLPEIVVLCMALLVLVVNPALRRWLPRFALSHQHLALIVGMMLFAGVVPSNGLFRFLPHCLALDTEQINTSHELAQAVESSALPAALFPDAIGFDLDTPVASQLVDERYPGVPIPWAAWVRPLLAWGTVIVGLWILMIGMAFMVFPQWLDRERLAFPLLKVYHAIIEEPEEGRLLPPVFRSRLFWVGCGAILLMHSTNGLAIYTDGAFPAFPVSWDVSDVFTEGVWRYAPGFLKRSRIYFLFVGLAFFMPTRYSFSIWSTVLFFGLVVMFSRMYVPSFEDDMLYDQGCGALIAISLGVVWLGRSHYTRVLCAAFGRRAGTEENRVDALGGRLFLLGCTVVFAWFMWAGAGFFWALLFVILGVMVMLMVSRIVAEMGITYIWIIPLTASRLIGLVPEKWTSVSTAFLQEAHYVLVNRASAVSAAAITILALGLNRDATPASRRRIAGIGLTLLVLGLLVCGAVHLHMGYTLAESFDGVNTPITGRGARLMSLQPMRDLLAGRGEGWQVDQIKAILFGCALAGVLLALCARFPSWPLHPIGLIFVHSSIGLRLVISLLLGWAIKSLLVHYGGARAYRKAMPLFLGMIIGEVFTNAVWTLVPVIQLLMGIDPADIKHMVIFQYT